MHFTHRRLYSRPCAGSGSGEHLTILKTPMLVFESYTAPNIMLSPTAAPSPSLSPSSYMNREESNRIARSRSRQVGRKNMRVRCRSTSSTRSRSRSCSAPRQHTRSRSSSACRRPKQGLVRFVVPAPQNPPAAHDSDDVEALQRQFAEGMRGMSMHTTSVHAGDGNRVACPTPLSPVRKRQRNRSASAKRRSRPIYREAPNRRRNARAPSRSRGRSIDMRRATSIGRLVKKGARARSRSPMDHASQWLFAVRAERGGPDALRSPILVSPHNEQRQAVAPSLCITFSEDVGVRVIHDELMTEFGYQNMDGRPPHFA